MKSFFSPFSTTTHVRHQVSPAAALNRLAKHTRVVPANRNCRLDLASFFRCTLEICWLGMQSTCGVGLFLSETGWLGAGFINRGYRIKSTINECLETRWLSQTPWSPFAGTLLYTNGIVLMFSAQSSDLSTIKLLQTQWCRR